MPEEMGSRVVGMGGVRAVATLGEDWDLVALVIVMAVEMAAVRMASKPRKSSHRDSTCRRHMCQR